MFKMKKRIEKLEGFELYQKSWNKVYDHEIEEIKKATKQLATASNNLLKRILIIEKLQDKMFENMNIKVTKRRIK